MFHNKEIIGFEKPFRYNLSSNEISSGLSFSKVRFGELKVDSLFFFNGVCLKKIDDYNAETNKKNGNEKFLFFKKDIVKIEKETNEFQTPKKLPESIFERDCLGSKLFHQVNDNVFLSIKTIVISPRFHRDELEFEVFLGDKKTSYLSKPFMVGDFYNWSFRFSDPLMGFSISQKNNHLSISFKDQIIWENQFEQDFKWDYVYQFIINLEIV